MDAKNQPAVQYVLAVSGGIDSVVLLHIMARHMASQLSSGLLVAHFDHGIRDDSSADRQFVEALARSHGLPFAYEQVALGRGVSEAAARDARYAFLRRLKAEHGARAIVTAHHSDDVLETAILNLMRGTGRKGLSSLQTTDELYRPLLRTPKAHIRAYAQKHGLQWREDSTNANTEYLRNYVRLKLLPRLHADDRKRLEVMIAKAHRYNQTIDKRLAEQLSLQPDSRQLDRHWFIMLPHAVSREVMAAWLRANGLADFDRRTIERLTVAAKTYMSGKQADISKHLVMHVGSEQLSLQSR